MFDRISDYWIGKKKKIIVLISYLVSIQLHIILSFYLILTIKQTLKVLTIVHIQTKSWLS